MYASFLSHHAVTHPGAVAVLTNDAAITYLDLNQMVDRTALALDAILPPGRLTVAVQAGEIRHWVLLLALSRLGHISFSGPPTRERFQIARPDLLLSETNEEVGVPVLMLDSTWWERTVAAEWRPLQERAGWDDPARLILSSGTTGLPKRVLLTHRMVRKRVAYEIIAQACGPFVGPAARICVSFHMASIGGFVGPLIGWTMGGSVLFEQVTDLERLRALSVTSIVVSTVMLSELVDRLPKDFEPIPNLTITVGGSLVTATLARLARERITPNIIVAYGSTEGGVPCSGNVSILDTEAHEVGILYPWIELQIVDAEHRTLPFGETGIVRIRGEAVVPGYDGDSEATAEAFRDGWFYPGDVGSLSEDRRVTILGRQGDVLFGGTTKIAPEVLEEYLRASPAVADAAAFTRPDAKGISRFHIAVVLRKQLSRDDMAALVGRGPVPIEHTWVVSKIPRNAAGKIERNKLKTQIDQVLRKRSTGPRR